LIKHIIITATILSFMPLHASQRCPVSVKVFNPGSKTWKEAASGWGRALKSRAIYNWGRSRGVYLIEDRGPVVDGSAAYVSSKGSKVVLTGIKRGCFYRLWIDFVGFRLYGKRDLTEVLRIYIGREDKGYRLLKVIRFSDLDSGKMEYIDIPYGMTVHDTFEIVFGDYSVRNGFWGIWDIILTTERKIPAGESLREKKKDGSKKK
jgi:hypothetical protein